MTDEYADPRIEITANDLLIRGYYMPWGAKRIPIDAIRAVTRFEPGTLGRWRIWGTANPRYWANLDPGRPAKEVAFALDVGRRVQPFLTPDDPAAFEAALRTRMGFPVEESDDAR